MRKLAFLGLGVMGTGMAAQLLRAGHPLAVWNRTRSKSEPLADIGATVASSPAEAASQAEGIHYCLANDKAVEELVYGEHGLLNAVRPGQIVVDHSTVHPNLARRQAADYSERGVRFVDAPVFGTKPHANEGKLWIVAGGDRQTYEQLEDIFSVIGQAHHYMGEAGKGATMKLVGNHVVSMQIEALGEALLLARHGGLDLEMVIEVLGETDFRSPLFTGMGRAVLERSFEDVSFELRHMLKDADLIASLADDLGSPLPGGAVVREKLKAAVNSGLGRENVSALIKQLEAEAGVTLGDEHKD